jgi:hypothetical protein
MRGNVSAVMIFEFIKVRWLGFGDGNEATDGFGAFRLNGFAFGEGFKNVAEIVRSRDPAAFAEVGVGVVNAASVECLAVPIEDDYFRGDLRAEVMRFA